MERVCFPVTALVKLKGVHMPCQAWDSPFFERVQNEYSGDVLSGAMG